METVSHELPRAIAQARPELLGCPNPVNRISASISERFSRSASPAERISKAAYSQQGLDMLYILGSFRPSTTSLFSVFSLCSFYL
jgi:hypothetical protein